MSHDSSQVEVREMSSDTGEAFVLHRLIKSLATLRSARAAFSAAKKVVLLGCHNRPLPKY